MSVSCFVFYQAAYRIFYYQGGRASLKNCHVLYIQIYTHDGKQFIQAAFYPAKEKGARGNPPGNHDKRNSIAGFIACSGAFGKGLRDMKNRPRWLTKRPPLGTCPGRGILLMLVSFIYCFLGLKLFLCFFNACKKIPLGR